jgi:cytochrome c oxidase cbb3-type subunit III
VNTRWVLTALLAAAPLVGQSPPKNPFAGSAADIDVGRGTFRIYCSPCHGIHAQGGRGPDLTRGVYEAGDGDADLHGVIADGVPGSEMPGYGARMNTDSIWRLVAYIRSTVKPETETVRGDAARGRAVYRGKGGCTACHEVAGEGGRMGPELTRVGRSRSLANLRRSLVDPDYELTPGYGTVEVETADGKTLRGIERNFDNFSVALLDGGGRLHSFERSEVRRAERTRKSTMPNYKDSLNAAELDDLLAYLVSLRGEERSR